MDKKIKELEKLAASGNKDALESLARFYYQDGQDDNPKVDFEKAFYYLKDAVKFHTPDIMHKYAMCKYYGLGTDKDVEEAYKYLVLAAEKDYPNSVNNIGTMYMTGEIVEKDPVKAREYLERAAKLGSEVAIRNLKKLDLTDFIERLNNYHLSDLEAKETILKELTEKYCNEGNHFQELIRILNEYVYPALERNEHEPLQSDEIRLIVELSGLLVSAMLNGGSVTEAKELLESLVELNREYDDDPKVKLNNTARLLWRLGNVESILGDTDSALKHNNLAFEFINKSFQIFENQDEYDLFLNTYSLFVRIYNSTNEFEKSIDMWEKYTKLYNSIPEEIRGTYEIQNALFTLTISDTYIYMKDFDNAIKVAEKVVNNFKEKNKTDLVLDILSQAEYHVGAANFEMEKYVEASEAFVEAICTTFDISDESSRALRSSKYMLSYGRLLFRVDEYEKAIDLYEKIINICNDNDFYGRMDTYFECIDYISRCYFRLDNNQMAIDIINNFFECVKDGDFDGENYQQNAASMAYTMASISKETNNVETQKKWLLTAMHFLENVPYKNADYYVLYNIIVDDLNELN